MARRVKKEVNDTSISATTTDVVAQEATPVDTQPTIDTPIVDATPVEEIIVNPVQRRFTKNINSPESPEEKAIREQHIIEAELRRRDREERARIADEEKRREAQRIFDQKAEVLKNPAAIAILKAVDDLQKSRGLK